MPEWAVDPTPDTNVAASIREKERTLRRQMAEETKRQKQILDFAARLHLSRLQLALLWVTAISAVASALAAWFKQC